MTADLDIWRAAHLIIKRHGGNAPVVVAQHADKLCEDDDLRGAAVWRRIISAIEELQRVVRRAGWAPQ